MCLTKAGEEMRNELSDTLCWGHPGAKGSRCSRDALPGPGRLLLFPPFMCKHPARDPPPLLEINQLHVPGYLRPQGTETFSSVLSNFRGSQTLRHIFTSLEPQAICASKCSPLASAAKLALFIFDSLKQNSTRSGDKTVPKPLETCCPQDITATSTIFPPRVTHHSSLWKMAPTFLLGIT